MLRGLDPFGLYPEGSPEAASYQRMAKVDGRRVGVVGGMGGSSIRPPSASSSSSSASRLATSLSRSIPLPDFRRAQLVLYERLGRYDRSDLIY